MGASQLASTTPGPVLVRVISPMSRGGSGVSTMVMPIESEAAWVPSSTVSVRIKVVLELTWGAVNVVEGAVELANSIAKAESWLHE